jgi:flagellar export protein FliJ
VSRRFQFRLQRVERVREIQEQEARGAFALAEAEARAREADCERAQGELQRGRAALGALQAAARIDVQAVLLAQRGTLSLTRALRVARERLQLARARSDELRRAWQEREQAREALGRLGERARTRHVAEQARVELAEIEESVQARSARALSALPQGSSRCASATDIDGPERAAR